MERQRTAPPAATGSLEGIGLVLWAEITFVVMVALVTGRPPAIEVTVGFALAIAVLVALTAEGDPTGRMPTSRSTVDRHRR